MQKIPTNAALLPLGLSSRGQTSAACKKIGMVPPQGFTLVELTVVLIIVSLLLGGLLMPLSAQNSIEQHKKTAAVMRDARDALGGFVLIRDRVPCPAPLPLADESPQGGHCAAQSGFLPLSLGIPSLDAWGRPLRYAVATQAWNFDPALPQPPVIHADIPTTPGAILSLGIPLDYLRTDLGACSPGTQHAHIVTGQTLTCTAPDRLIGDKIGAIIWSDGADPTTPTDDVVDWIAWPTLGGLIARVP